MHSPLLPPLSLSLSASLPLVVSRVLLNRHGLSVDEIKWLHAMQSNERTSRQGKDVAMFNLSSRASSSSSHVISDVSLENEDAKLPRSSENTERKKVLEILK